MTTVLYIMGLYRSGSTVTDVVLSNHPGMAGVGELRNLAVLGWARGTPCSCGCAVEACPFWRAVREDWEMQVGPDRLDRLAELQDRFERLRSLPRLLGSAAIGRSAAFSEYARLLGALYASIAKASGGSVVVDSTKYPMRALALLRVPGIDAKLVHLVRDGRAVIWSVRRKQNTDLEGRTREIDADELAAFTAKQWRNVNLACDLVARVAGRRAIRVRYEDFVGEPARELARIGALLGLETSELAHRVAAGEALDAGHTVAGNRMRLAGAVRLRPDDEWHARLSEQDRATFARHAGRLARRYGYDSA